MGDDESMEHFPFRVMTLVIGICTLDENIDEISVVLCFLQVAALGYLLIVSATE